MRLRVSFIDLLRRAGFQRTFLITLSSVSLVSILVESQALASKFYLDIGAGASSITGGSNFFNNGQPIAIDRGICLTVGLGTRVSNSNAEIGLHLGLQYRIASGSTSSMSYSVQGLYPIIGFEASRLTVFAGITPLIWKRISPTPGFFDSLHLATPGIGILLGTSYLWMITPQVAIGLMFDGQTVFTSGSFSPKPAIEGTGFLRFLLGHSPSALDAPDPVQREKYDGYRYPFGNPRN